MMLDRHIILIMKSFQYSIIECSLLKGSEGLWIALAASIKSISLNFGTLSTTDDEELTVLIRWKSNHKDQMSKFEVQIRK